MLEALKHSESSFVTLTYDDERIPPGGSLEPKDTQLWLKRFRKAIAPIPLRYFLVGEYGDQTWRPHYHAVLFGVGLPFASVVHDSWGKGHTLLLPLSRELAQYTAGYTTKKMTSREDVRLAGRNPEFARMSLRPGIGAAAMTDVANTLNTSQGAKLVAATGDVPVVLQHGRQKMPLGRYLRRKLRDEMGFEELGGQEKPAYEQAKEMYELCEAKGTAKYFEEKAEKEKVKIRQLEGKARIWAKKGSI